MMKNILIAFLLIISFGCNSKGDNNFETKEVSKKNSIIKDTIITYNIEGISSEGAEAVVNYKNKNIYKSQINIYGETGQAELTYKFYPKKIEVTQKQYYYKEDLKNLNNKDLLPNNTIKYDIDYNGKPIETSKGIIDIFKEFKQSVPFKIK